METSLSKENRGALSKTSDSKTSGSQLSTVPVSLQDSPRSATYAVWLYHQYGDKVCGKNRCSNQCYWGA